MKCGQGFGGGRGGAGRGCGMGKGGADAGKRRRLGCGPERGSGRKEWSGFHPGEGSFDGRRVTRSEAVNDRVPRGKRSLSEQISGGRCPETDNSDSLGPGSAFPSRSTASVDADLCILCGLCVDMCMTEAISLAERVTIVTEKCTGCGACVTVCPNEAIMIK